MKEEKTSATKEYDFNVEIKLMETQKPQFANHILSQLMLQEVATDETKIIKYFDWAKELTQSGVLKLDRGDVSEIKKFVIADTKMYVVAKAPILQVLEN